MQVASDKYKEYIQKDVRNFNFSAIIIPGDSITSNQTSYTNKASISDANTVFDNLPFTYNYAYLQDDYFKLDGTFILPNRSDNIYTGFIANDHTCSLSFAKMNNTLFFKNGLTIYFGNGYATNFTVSYYVYSLQTQEYTLTGEKTYTDNDKEVVNVPRVGDYSSDDYGRKITITINQWSNNYFPIIKKIIGYDGVLLGNDDVSFKHLEETDLRGLNIPSNSFSLTLDNYDREYNILDEDSILNKLGSGTKITSYIGLDIDGAYEYLYLGEYYYKSYKSNSNKTIELDFIGLSEWQDNNLRPNSYSTTQTYTPDQIRQQMFSNLSTDTNCLHYSGNFPCSYLPYTTRREQQLEALIYYNASVKQTKNDKANLLPFNIDEVNQGIEDYTISLDRQIKNPEFTKAVKTRIVRFNYYTFSSSTSKAEIYNDTINFSPASGGGYYGSVSIYTNYPIYYQQGNFNIDVYYNGTKIIDNGSLDLHAGFGSSWSYALPTYYCLGSITLNPETYDKTTGTFRIEVPVYNKLDNVIEKTKSGLTSGATIEINTNTIKTDEEMERISQMIFDYEDAYPFEFEIEIMGDTRLEVGDKIRIESLDGYHLAIIERIDTTYNGGLTQIIKGVSSGVLQ